MILTKYRPDHSRLRVDMDWCKHRYQIVLVALLYDNIFYQEISAISVCSWSSHHFARTCKYCAVSSYMPTSVIPMEQEHIRKMR